MMDTRRAQVLAPGTEVLAPGTEVLDLVDLVLNTSRITIFGAILIPEGRRHDSYTVSGLAGRYIYIYIYILYPVSGLTGRYIYIYIYIYIYYTLCQV